MYFTENLYPCGCKVVTFPDIDPNQLPEDRKFSMAAGDFLDVYNDSEYTSSQGRIKLIFSLGISLIISLCYSISLYPYISLSLYISIFFSISLSLYILLNLYLSIFFSISLSLYILLNLSISPIYLYLYFSLSLYPSLSLHHSLSLSK